LYIKAFCFLIVSFISLTFGLSSTTEVCFLRLLMAFEYFLLGTSCFFSNVSINNAKASCISFSLSSLLIRLKNCESKLCCYLKAIVHYCPLKKNFIQKSTPYMQHFIQANSMSKYTKHTLKRDAKNI